MSGNFGLQSELARKQLTTRPKLSVQFCTGRIQLCRNLGLTAPGLQSAFAFLPGRPSFGPRYGALGDRSQEEQRAPRAARPAPPKRRPCGCALFEITLTREPILFHANQRVYLASSHKKSLEVKRGSYGQVDGHCSPHREDLQLRSAQFQSRFPILSKIQPQAVRVWFSKLDFARSSPGYE